MKIKFKADSIKIKPPNVSDEIKVEFTTGVYELGNLNPAFMWQGEQALYEITVKKLDSGKSIDNKGIAELDLNI